MKLFEFARSRPTASRAPQRAIVKALGDFALVGAGAAIAFGSVAFAAAMFLQDNHTPRINGMQYLAIFAKPRGTSRPNPADSPVVAAAAARRDADNAVDMTPTGSVPHDAAGAAPTGSRPQDPVDMAPTGSVVRGAPGESTPDGGYRILAVEPGMAWLSKGGEICVVKPGDVAPGLGRVASIERRGGRWILVDEMGATLLTSDDSATKDPGAEDGRSRAE